MSPDNFSTSAARVLLILDRWIRSTQRRCGASDGSSTVENRAPKAPRRHSRSREQQFYSLLRWESFRKVPHY